MTNSTTAAQPLDLDKLEALAKAATPGPWRECGHDRGGCRCALIWSPDRDELVAEAWKGDDMVPAATVAPAVNAAFIAAANPATILTLIAQARAAQPAGAADTTASEQPYIVDARVIAKHYASATLLKDQKVWPGAVMLHFSDNDHAEFAFEVLSVALTAGLATSARTANRDATLAPVAAQQAAAKAPAAQAVDAKDEQQQANVLPPFAAPAGIDKDAWVEEIGEVAELYGRLLAEKQRVHIAKGRDRGTEYYIADGIHWAIGELERRCRAQGGNTNDKDISAGAATTSDTERLDFMADEECRIEVMAGPLYRLHWPDRGEWQCEWSKTPREAIDAAMRATQQEGE